MNLKYIFLVTTGFVAFCGAHNRIVVHQEQLSINGENALLQASSAPDHAKPAIATCQAPAPSTVPQVIAFDINGVLLDSRGIIIPEGMALMRKCIVQGHTIMFLSNGSESNIGRLFIQAPHILRHVRANHILLSSITHYSKPSDDAYLHLKFVLEEDPAYSNAQIFFIDDMSWNIAAADKHGIRGVFLDTQKGYRVAYAHAEKELKRLGLRI